MNRISIEGRLTADAKMNTKGNACFLNVQSIDGKSKSFFNCTAFDTVIESVQGFKVNQLVRIVGKMTTYKNKEGMTAFSVVISTAEKEGAGTAPDTFKGADDEVPF